VFARIGHLNFPRKEHVATKRARNAGPKNARTRWPHLSSADFVRAFPMRDPAIQRMFVETLEGYGF
jgi:hypothetical protein